jgi:hypothetical protein
MARLISEIYNQMVAEKEALATLNVYQENTNSNAATPYLRLLADINSQSKVAVWRLIFFIVSAAIWLHETYWDKFTAEVNEKIKFATAGNIPWYYNLVVSYQHNYDLVYKDKTYQYLTIDETAKIVKRCSVNESGEQLTIKVAGEADGQPIKLTPEQFSGLSSYVAKMKFAGTRIQLVNENSDELKFKADVYYNPMVAGVRENAIASVVTYLKNLDFNGAIFTNKFIDAMQSVNGVNDIVLNQFQARPGTADFSDIVRLYIPYAGHIKIWGGIDFTDQTTDADGNIILRNTEGVEFKFIPYV